MLIALASVQLVHGQQADSGPGRSPFLPQGWEQRTPAAERPVSADATPGGYVFNGMIQIGSRTLFSISNTQSGQAMLIESGDSSGEVQIAGYDPQRNIVSLRGAGRTEELTLRKSDGEPLATAAAGNATAGGNRAAGNMQRRQAHSAQDGDTPARSGPPIEWLEARRNRLNEQIEQRRSQTTTQGSGAVAVGVDTSSGSDSAGSNNQNRMQRSGQSDGTGQSGQGVRPRRLRMEMNP